MLAELYQIDWTKIIMAAIFIVTGGAALKFYQAYISKRQVERQDEFVSEQAFMSILKNRVVELEGKVDNLNNKITELIQSNAQIIIKLTAENASLNEKLNYYKLENSSLKERIEELTK